MKIVFAPCRSKKPSARAEAPARDQRLTVPRAVEQLAPAGAADPVADVVADDRAPAAATAITATMFSLPREASTPAATSAVSPGSGTPDGLEHHDQEEGDRARSPISWSSPLIAEVR